MKVLQILSRYTHHSVISLLLIRDLCNGALNASFPRDDTTAFILSGPFIKTITGGLAGHERWTWLRTWNWALAEKTVHITLGN